MKHTFITSLLTGIALMSITSDATAADARHTVSSTSSSLKVLSVANAITGQPVIGFSVQASIDPNSCLSDSQGKLCLADFISAHENFGERRFSELIVVPDSVSDLSDKTSVAMDVKVPAPIASGDSEWTVQFCIQHCQNM